MASGDALSNSSAGKADPGVTRGSPGSAADHGCIGWGPTTSPTHHIHPSPPGTGALCHGYGSVGGGELSRPGPPAQVRMGGGWVSQSQGTLPDQLDPGHMGGRVDALTKRGASLTATGLTIRITIPRPRAVGERKGELCEEECPMGLLGVQPLGGTDGFKLFMVGPYLEGVLDPLKPVPLLL